ncbi:MAG: hypothetical protein V1644_03100, partial [Candidatus Micrarchaeota archaeon]
MKKQYLIGIIIIALIALTIAFFYLEDLGAKAKQDDLRFASNNITLVPIYALYTNETFNSTEALKCGETTEAAIKCVERLAPNQDIKQKCTES